MYISFLGGIFRVPTNWWVSIRHSPTMPLQGEGLGYAPMTGRRRLASGFFGIQCDAIKEGSKNYWSSLAINNLFFIPFEVVLNARIKMKH